MEQERAVLLSDSASYVNNLVVLFFTAPAPTTSTRTCSNGFCSIAQFFYLIPSQCFDFYSQYVHNTLQQYNSIASVCYASLIHKTAASPLVHNHFSDIFYNINDNEVMETNILANRI